MKNIISFCTVLMIFFSVSATAANGPGKDNDGTKVVKEANFTGGDTELTAYIQENLVYPTCAREQSLEGEVVISFFVLRDGSIHGARVVQGFDEVCDAKALEVVKEMPNWTPATANGKPAASKKYLTIKFELEI